MLWYEQTVEERVAAMRFYAERNRECEAYHRSQRKPWSAREADRYAANAVRLDALADEMIRTGVVLA